MADGYAGDLTAGQSWQTLTTDPDAVLIDVRSQAEWAFVGVPVLDEIGKKLVRIEWQGWPDGRPNANFVEQVRQAGVRADQKVLLLCRSGARSAAAARLLTAQGWAKCYNVSNGFEGPPDDSVHRGRVAGWKFEKLPWAQG